DGGGSGNYSDSQERRRQEKYGSLREPQRRSDGSGEHASALPPDHIPFAQRPALPRNMVVLRINKGFGPLPTRSVVKANVRAFGALEDKDIIMSHKHLAIAMRYATETNARAAFQACQERASNWFNIPKNAIRVALEQEKPPVNYKAVRGGHRGELGRGRGRGRSSAWNGSAQAGQPDEQAWLAQPAPPPPPAAAATGVPMDPRKARAAIQQPQPIYQQPQQQAPPPLQQPLQYQQPQQQAQPQLQAQPVYQQPQWQLPQQQQQQQQQAPMVYQQLPQQLSVQPPQAGFQGWQQPQQPQVFADPGQQQQQQQGQQPQGYIPYTGPAGQRGLQWQQPEPQTQQQAPQQLPQQPQPQPQQPQAVTQPEAEMAALDLMAILRNAGVKLDQPASAGEGSGHQRDASNEEPQAQQPSTDQQASQSDAGDSAEANANISDQLMSLVGLLSSGAVGGS
ncbi:hypothetical protein WJX84_004534, partial [Apatococcus fuscideae]